MDYQLLLIGRHGQLSDHGAIQEVAESLAKTLRELDDSDWPIAITAVEHVGTLESRATAGAYAGALRVRPTIDSAVALGPHGFPPYRRDPRQESCNLLRRASTTA